MEHLKFERLWEVPLTGEFASLHRRQGRYISPDLMVTQRLNERLVLEFHNKLSQSGESNDSHAEFLASHPSIRREVMKYAVGTSRYTGVNTL